MKPRHLLLATSLAVLTCLLVGAGLQNDPTRFHGLRVISPTEASAIKGGGPTIICQGRICNDVETGKCSSNITDACKGVKCQYFQKSAIIGRMVITERRCQVDIEQELCETPVAKNYECTESHAVNDDECKLTGFDSHCGWKELDDCHLPVDFPEGVWGCSDGCFPDIARGQYCEEGCFPFLM